MTPNTFPGGRSKLRYVRRPNGPDLLVLDKGGQTKTGRYRKGSATIVMFILVRQVKLRGRLRDYRRTTTRIESMLPAMIIREYEREARNRGQ